MTPQAVAFDLDGLMFNTEDLYIEVGTELLRRRGCTFENDLREKMMGRPSRIALQLMIDHHQLDATVDILQSETDEIFADLLPRKLTPLPGLMDLLAALEARDIPKSVCTSSRRSFVDRVLPQFELESRFAFILTSEDVTHGKPHPEIYQTAAARFGVEPAAMLVLEDSENGVRSGVQAGAITVAIPGGHITRRHYPGAALTVDSLQDPRLWELLAI